MFGSALASATTYLSLTLCDGSSRKLIAGWWYVKNCLREGDMVRDQSLCLGFKWRDRIVTVCLGDGSHS